MATIQMRKAARSKAKIRLGLSGPSGSGKTTGALLAAYGLCGDWDKICLIDTENRSADLYANFTIPGTKFTIGEFQKIDIDAPYNPERYIEAIHAAEEAGMEVVVIDSISHEWEGKGGCLEIHERLGGQFKHWAEVTPRHRAFIDAILQSPIHVITCARAKIDYAVTTDGGKTKVEKVGLKDVTREGFDYELTADLDLDLLHNARASKDRTGLFMDRPAFVMTVETGIALKAWSEKGEPPAPAATVSAPAAATNNPQKFTAEGIIAEIKAAKTEDALQDIVAKIKGVFQGKERDDIGVSYNARKKELESGSGEKKD